MRWDVFCRVIDNWGDAGVCWRLAADLASRGERVRLWIDDPSPLSWMAPGGAAGVEVVAWNDGAPQVEPGDAVVEAFGCDPPAAFVARMAAAARAPVWIDLEYLSAEAHVDASHGLPSPQQVGPGRGLVKRFWFPGFTAGSGGLIREPGLLQARAAFDRDGWLDEIGAPRDAGERVVVLFCYDNARLPELLDRLGDRRTLLLVAAGIAARQVAPQLGSSLRRGSLRAVLLPLLTQPAFDRLLWSADLAFVRGEDSLVRAIWAGVPFVWHIYPQHDGVHARKLSALLDRMQADAPLRALWRRWNGLDDGPLAVPALEPWQERAGAFRDRLAAREDLTSRLIAFAESRR